MSPEQTTVMETPDAGGYGAPSQRHPDKIREDLQSGKFTPDFIAA